MLRRNYGNPAKQFMKTLPPRESGHTPAFTVGTQRLMSDRSPQNPSDMHWPVFDEHGGCVAHFHKKEMAALFAAAPALYAALEGLLNDYRDKLSWDGGWEQDRIEALTSIIAAQKAIAEARP